MKRLPKIGERVSFPGNTVIGPCVGTVCDIYPTYKWINDETPSDETNPHEEWKAGIQVDSVPKLWPYSDTDHFASPVKHLKLVR